MPGGCQHVGSSQQDVAVNGVAASFHLSPADNTTAAVVVGGITGGFILQLPSLHICILRPIAVGLAEGATDGL